MWRKPAGGGGIAGGKNISPGITGKANEGRLPRASTCYCRHLCFSATKYPRHKRANEDYAVDERFFPQTGTGECHISGFLP